ncbi:hypothetical protein AMJ57_03505 [Parcubacteria bacterium SG8_24]|nr:MAG: hypothetical protein AMJ57_03505 [Parcubacteria bacterium SG8_24]
MAGYAVWTALIPVGGALFLLPVGYFVWLYLMYRRPPVRGRALVAEYEAPPEIGPAEAGYLLDGRLRARALAATLIDLMLRGIIRIEVEDSRVRRLQLAGRPEEAGLEPYEMVLLSDLFTDGPSVDAVSAARRIRSGERRLKDSVRSWLDHQGYLGARDWSRPIIAVSAAVGALITAMGLWSTAGFAAAVVQLTVSVALIEYFYIAATWRPILSRRGQEAVWHLLGYRRYLEAVESGRIRWTEERDAAGLHRLSPYAVMYGITPVWATRLQQVTEALIGDIV